MYPAIFSINYIWFSTVPNTFSRVHFDIKRNYSLCLVCFNFFLMLSILATLKPGRGEATIALFWVTSHVCISLVQGIRVLCSKNWEQHLLTGILSLAVTPEWKALAALLVFPSWITAWAARIWWICNGERCNILQK